MVRRSIRSLVRRGLERVVPVPEPYQSFFYRGRFVEGRLDTVRLFHSFRLVRDISGGASWLDLGCNEGSICISAREHGAGKVVGVELSEAVHDQAQRRARDAGAEIEYVLGNVIDFTESCPEQYDVVTLLAMIRHVHSALLKRKGIPIRKTGRPHLIYESYDAIIRGTDDPVKAEFDAWMRRCIGLARKHFICSFHDQTGLILRRREETAEYFRSLDPRCTGVEVYAVPTLEDYPVVQLRLC